MLGPKRLFVKCVDIHAFFTGKVKNANYFFMTVVDRTDISVLWVQWRLHYANDAQMMRGSHR